MRACAKYLLLFVVLFFMPELAHAEQVNLNVALGRPVLKADKKQIAHLLVGMRGFRMQKDAQRTPVNVALVLDVSGSMQGDKIENAKRAAIHAVQLLNENDVLSILVYSDEARVILPATKLTDKETVFTAIRNLEADGSTALFAGVTKGAEEVDKFIDKNRVNRIILLSDGLANVGPQTPAELGTLGSQLREKGIAVTTFGLGGGYNEDLMSQLARNSDGNHAFIESPNDLARIFGYEFGDVLSVVAQQVRLEIRLAEGIRPVRVMNREADIKGQIVSVGLNQLYSEQEKLVLLEIEVPAGEAGSTRPVAEVSLTYGNMQTKTEDTLTSAIAVRFSSDDAVVGQEENKKVQAEVVKMVATERNREAVRLRDQGDIPAARKMFEYNTLFLRENAEQYDDDSLRAMEAASSKAAEEVDSDEDWHLQRKQIRKDAFEAEAQQSY